MMLVVVLLACGWCGGVGRCWRRCSGSGGCSVLAGGGGLDVALAQGLYVCGEGVHAALGGTQLTLTHGRAALWGEVGAGLA